MCMCDFNVLHLFFTTAISIPYLFSCPCPSHLPPSRSAKKLTHFMHHIATIKQGHPQLLKTVSFPYISYPHKCLILLFCYHHGNDKPSQCQNKSSTCALNLCPTCLLCYDLESTPLLLSFFCGKVEAKTHYFL